MKLINYIKSNPKIIITIIIIGFFIYLMLLYNLDKRAIAIITIILGFVTNIFSSLIILIELIPIIGPIVVKILTIPFFWLINGMGYISSIYAIKKGYKRDFLTHRLITIVLLIGIILGYILGHLIPVK